VKNLIKAGNVEGIEEKDIIYGTGKKIFKNITSKPVLPNETEIKNNTRARSAKLRAAIKL
jgi:16S rRNA (cytosine1402-N4)-methyltransferase